MDKPAESDNRALINFAEGNLGAKIMGVSHPAGAKENRKAVILVLPRDQQPHSIKKFLDEYLTAPERRKGTAKLTDADSFIAHVNRFKDADSAVFALADPKAPKLLSVIDYHRAGGEGQPRFGEHRALYDCPLSEEWKAWTASDGAKMAQGDFAEFIEDRIGDMVAAPQFSDDEQDAKLVEVAAMLGGKYCLPSTMMELSKGIQVHSTDKVHQAVNLATGEIEIQSQSDHGEAGTRFRANNLFLVCIPVFENGPLYRLVGRLRYRVANGTIVWFYDLWRADKVFKHAFDELCTVAAERTSLPVFRGQPEA